MLKINPDLLIPNLLLVWWPYGGFAAAILIIILGVIHKKTPRKSNERVKSFLIMMTGLKSRYPLTLIACKAWLIGHGVTFSVVFIVLCLSISFTLFPVMGFKYGKEELIESVINPDHCSLPRSYMIHYEMMQKKGTIKKQEKKIEPGGASCYRVEKDGKELGRGRRVIHAYDTIYLYDPDTSKTTPYDTKGAIVEQITSLKRDDVKEAE